MQDLKAARLPLDEDEMIAAIGRWVACESPTSDRASVDRMLDIVTAEFEGHDVAIERIPGTRGYADMLKVASPGAEETPGILVLSHVDTVHPIGMIERLPFKREGDKLYGPGLYDMKGGAYIALHAFRTLQKAEALGLPVTFLFTPDEEVGSPTSRGLIEELAMKNRFALVTEPARDGGKCVTARKGVGRFVATTHGRPAHAGTRHQDGRSAIREMARQILAVEGLTDYTLGITTTVGVIHGGTAPNVTPETCVAEIDLRAPDAVAAARAVKQIEALTAYDPDVRLEIVGGMNRPPYEKTPEIEALLAHAQDVARALGRALEDCPMTGGGSDGNFTSARGLPTLDGLGIDGDGAHTAHEHGLVSSIVPQTRLMMGLMETLGR